MFRRYRDIITRQTVDNRFKTVLVDPDNGTPDGDGTNYAPLDTIPNALNFLNTGHYTHGVIYLLPGKTYRIEEPTDGDSNPVIRTPILHVRTLSGGGYLPADEQARIEIASKIVDDRRVAWSLTPGSYNLFTYFYNVFIYGEQGDTNYDKSLHFSLVDVYGPSAVMFQNSRIESGTHCVVSTRDNASNDVIFNACGIKAIDTLSLVDINYATVRLTGYSNGFDSETVAKVAGLKTDSNGAYLNALIDIDGSNTDRLDW